MKITEILTERFINLFDPSQKEQYADRVYELIQQSYAPIGGQHGAGFASPEDMIEKIPMWKLVRRNGEIVAGAMYKDTQGRKRVAVFTDGSRIGKLGLADIMKNDFDRAYFEVSGPSLRFIVKLLGEDFVKRYAKTPEEAEQILNKEVSPIDSNDKEASQYPQLQDHFYTRSIGGTAHTKILLGTAGRKIVQSI